MVRKLMLRVLLEKDVVKLMLSVLLEKDVVNRCLEFVGERCRKPMLGVCWRKT